MASEFRDRAVDESASRAPHRLSRIVQPWSASSRATALGTWRHLIAWIVALQASATLVKVFVDLVTRTGNATSGLLSVAEAGLVAGVLLLITRHAERRLLSRPPKALLAWLLGAFTAMAVWETGLSLLEPTADWFADVPFAACHVLAAISVLLLAGWLVGTRIFLSDTDRP